MIGHRGASAPSLPISVLRAAVQRQLADLSLRAAAREIGLSPNALRNFLRGATPRRATRVRLERWLAGRPGGGRGPTLQRFLGLLGAMTPDLSAEEATMLGREVSRLLLDAYQRQELPPPRWVRELARHYAPERR